MKIRLHRNVQFLYEKALADLEIKSFGIDGFSNPFQDPWTFICEDVIAPDQILKSSAYFADVDGVRSVYSHLITPQYQGGEFNVTRSVNQYLTHWIYPYKGKFHPQMIRAIFNIIGLKNGQTVLDPFSGSGTTVLEASVLGIDAIGLDISALCVLQGIVKTQAWRCTDEISKVKDQMVESKANPEDASSNSIVNDFFRLAKMVALSDTERRSRDFSVSYKTNIEKMHRSTLNMRDAMENLGLEYGSVSLKQADVRNFDQMDLTEESIDAIVTSPPYSIALDYVKNDEHALKALGFEPKVIKEEFIGVRGKPRDKIALYESDMRIALRNFARVLKKGGWCVIVIGNATYQTEIRTTDEIICWCEEAGLTLKFEMPKIVFGLYSVMTDEKILFFRRM